MFLQPWLNNNEVPLESYSHISWKKIFEGRLIKII